MDPFPFSLKGFVESLHRLTERTSDDAFVVLQDKETDHFIQFGRGPDLVLDLPLTPLSESQTERAHAFFRNLGVQAPIEFDAPDIENNTTRKHKVLQYNFGTNVGAAAQAAIDLFFAVYGPISLSRFCTIQN